MPVKTLPTVSNPTQLNEFLVQSLDNTNGGGINKFTTWLNRPTGLTADDQGKTIIFERTGNFHQWTGTVWKVLNTNNTINVEDFGAIGDGVTDCTAALNNAIATINSTINNTTLNVGTLKFPRGVYKVNIDLGSKRINIIGDGLGATILKPAAESKPVITTASDGAWDRLFIENLTISGSGLSGIGLQFGYAPYVNGNQFSGRVNINNVKFIDLEKCICRPYGNIGVYINNCSFFNANYHIWSKGYGTTPPNNMHSGGIIVSNTHFQNAKLASIYINSGSSGDGQYILKDNIFEENEGFVIYVDKFIETEIVPEITFENCWNERNYTATSVIIDTFTYTPPKFAYLKDCTNISFINTPLGTLQLKNSNVFCDRCDIGLLTTVTKDAQSLLIIDNAILESVKTNEFVRTIKNSIRLAGNFASYFATYHRDNLSKTYTANIVQSIKFNATYQFTGNILRNTTPRLNDGTTFDNSEQFLINQNEIFISNIQPQIKADRFYVFTLAYKAILGNPINLSISYNTTLVSALVLNSTKWKTMAGVISTFTVSGLPNTVALYLTPSALGGSSTVAFGGYQLLEFTNQQDAMEFLESKTFAS